jgi:hypothetical protein
VALTSYLNYLEVFCDLILFIFHFKTEQNQYLSFEENNDFNFKINNQIYFKNYCFRVIVGSKYMSKENENKTIYDKVYAFSVTAIYL